MTLQEFSRLYDGWLWRERYEKRKRCESLAYVMAGLSHGKTGPSRWFKILMGKDKQEVSIEQIKREHLRKARERRKRRGQNGSSSKPLGQGRLSPN